MGRKMDDTRKGLIGIGFAIGIIYLFGVVSGAVVTGIGAAAGALW